MRNTNRFLILGGGHVAALTLLLLSACGPGGDKHDSGQTPDAGPMADEGVDMPDAESPIDMGSDRDTGTISDSGTDGGEVCTPEMMLNRVNPPCDPDTNTGAGHGPTGMEGLAGPGTWFDGIGYCATNTGVDAMGRIWFGMWCHGTELVPGAFYYDLNGLWYSNWKNRAQQESARMSINLERTFATMELFHAGESIAYDTVTSTR